MIDTHCHLTHPRLSGEADAIVARAREAGLTACITIGTGAADARKGLDLAAGHPGFVFCAVGIDPFTSHAAGVGFDDELADVRALLASGRFCALGEIGLDYHYELDPAPVQAERFERQLELAVELDRPVVLHVREAHVDMARLLALHPRNRGVVHSFTGTPAEASRYLELGWYLAFNGVVTFPSAADVREAARLVPVDRLLVETDSPYLSPVPLRGKRCEPAYVAHTLRFLAELRGADPASLDEATSRNAIELFGLATE